MIRETEGAIRGLLYTDAQSLAAEMVEGVREHGVEDAKGYALNFAIREDGIRATSRSTSVIANLVADVRRGVAIAAVDALTEYEAREIDSDPAEWLADRMHFRLTDIVR